MQVRHPLFFTLLFVFLTSATAPVHADALSNILERGEVKIGVSLFAPWAMKDKKGALKGFEIDVAEKIANDMGVKAAFKEYEWDKIIDALKSGEIDMIVAGMAITPERALHVNFSLPYAESGVSIATNTAMTKDIATFSELNSDKIRIAVVRKTMGHDLAKRIFNKAKVEVFTTENEAAKAVVGGKAHGYMASMEEVQFLALQHPKKIDVPLDSPMLQSKSGLAVKKGEQELLNFLNAWVVAREADKWLSTTHKYWFKSLGWLEETER